MEYYAIYIPDKKTDFSIKSFYNDKMEALSVLKQHKEARMKAFSSTEEAVSFYLAGPSESVVKSATVPISSPKCKAVKSLFVNPTSQMLVAFRKLIEANNVNEVRKTICANPRYLVSLGDTPTILKEGPRYNALHIAAIEGRGEICRLILQTIDTPNYIEKLHVQRTPSTDEVTAILLDLYLNMPDKCRSETPLHFAAKHGSIEVVKELIAYPQCRVALNTEGLLPREIICSRAKANNNTPEVREAIRQLLEERYFVPLLRYEDNVLPPIIGEPFSPSTPPKLNESISPCISPRSKIEAYAGPMDRNTADSFYRRWKSSPRLMVVSPQLLSPQPAGQSEMVRASPNITPIKIGRRLFADQLEAKQAENENNNTDKSEVEFNGCDEMGELESPTKMVEDENQPDDNGNHLAPVLASTPIRLFREYRTPVKEIDTSVDSNGSCVEPSFSYLCNQTRILYDHSRLNETPTHKERSMRLSNIEKGLENLGRNMAMHENINWNEYWKFLGKFCHLASKNGLCLFEQFLLERKRNTVPQQQIESGATTPCTNTLNPITLNHRPVEQASDSEQADLWTSDDSVDRLCDEMQRISVRDQNPEAIGEGAVYSKGVLPCQPAQRKLSNPYLCVTSSLKVFATRFVTQLLDLVRAVEHDNPLQASFLHIVQKLDTLVQNFRTDTAFHEVNFHKAHALFAFLIVMLVHQCVEDKDIAQDPIFARLQGMVMNVKEHVNLPVLATPTTDVSDSVQCIKSSIIFFIYNSRHENVKLSDETESECRRFWQEESLIVACSCRPKFGTNMIKRTTDRMKRRDERFKRLYGNSPSTNTPCGNTVCEDSVYDFATHPDEVIPPPSTESDGNGSSEDDDSYLSCNDTDEEGQEGIDEGENDDIFYTPPSSPTRGSLVGLPCDSNNNAGGDHGKQERKAEEGIIKKVLATSGSQERIDKDTTEENYGTSQLFLEGSVPTKQDLDIWAVLEAVEVDECEYPHVYAWKNAIREFIAKKDMSIC